jgi:hypothetical protein
MNNLTKIKLFAKGYSFEDISSLNELDIDDETAIELASKGATLEDITKVISIADPDPNPEPSKPEPEGKPDEKDEPDYKKLYEEAKATVTKLQADKAKAPIGKETPPEPEVHGFDYIAKLIQED